MPPKTVRCCICNQDVLKSQTYATGEKDDEGKLLRACKEHEGVMEKAEELKKKAHEELKKTLSESPFPGAKNHGIPLEEKHVKYAQKTSPQQREKDRQMLGKAQKDLKDVQEFAQWSWEHCWCCERRGLHLKDFYEMQLIAWEKAKMLGVSNPLSPDMHKIIRGIMKQLGADCVMHRFELDDTLFEKYTEWKNRIHYKCRVLPEMTRVIQLCFECQKRTGIEFDLRANLPKIDLDTLMTLGSVYEGSEAQKASRVLAAGSIIRDQEETVRKAENN